MANVNTVVEKRGAFLTTILLLQVIGSAFTLINFLLAQSPFLDRIQYPGWYKVWWVVDPFVRIVTVFGIWRWKRLAVYAVFLIMAVSYGLYYLFNYTYDIFPFSLIIPLILIVLWIWAIKRKWHLFR